MKDYPFLIRVSSFAGRAVVFFFIVAMISMFFYILGNYQDFLDRTQYLLLGSLRAALSFQLVVSPWLAGLLIYRAVQERRPYVARWVLLGLSFCASSVLLVSLRMIQQWLHA